MSAAVSAESVLGNIRADGSHGTLAKVEALLADAAVQGADLVVFPEVFVPGTPIWIDARPIWDGDEQWFAMLAEQPLRTEQGHRSARGSGSRQRASIW